MRAKATFPIYTLSLILLISKVSTRPWLVWLSQLEHRLLERKVAALIPGQGVFLG